MKVKELNTQTPSESETAEKSFPIVALGASAGGLEALQGFFNHMPADSGMAFVVIQHLNPTREEHAGGYPAKAHANGGCERGRRDEGRTKPRLSQSRRKGRRHLQRRLSMTDPVKIRGITLPIDHFLRSLAQDLGERALCVILSGTGSDGTLGLKAIKESGGMTIVQDPESAKYDGMPRSAILAGFADHILPVEKIPRSC